MNGLRWQSLVLGTAVLTGCGGSSDDSTELCMGGKCDGLGVVAKLEGREDPIAKFLRAAQIDDDGHVSADYGTVAAGIAKLQGCDEASWKTYVVSDNLLEEQTAFPRLVSTVCSGDATKASEFFIAASFKDEVEEDIDRHRLEMFAWDAKAGIYRFYAAEHIEKDVVQVEVDPKRCAGCHLTPKNLASDGMRMTPIMNELTRPWSHWNSQVPMFNSENLPSRSHEFEVPASVRDAKYFTMYGKDRVGAASELEQIIRAGHDRVALARVKERRNDATDWHPAMNLLRPIFCEEQVQFASEDFNAGEILATALIPGGVAEAYRANPVKPWSWKWIADGKLRLAQGTKPPVGMVPIRGNADVTYENQLLASKVLTPNQIMRVRALDWKRPVFSDFRCDLWRNAHERFMTTEPDLGLSGRISEHMKILFDQILTVQDVSLKTADDTAFYALDLASEESVLAMVSAIKDGTIPTNCEPGAPCLSDFSQFGDLLETYVSGFAAETGDDARSDLERMRNERLCHVIANFENQPALPEVVCDKLSSP